MQFHQHVYGRVAKGYLSGSPGYQLAALSESLTDRRDMIDKLNKMSFFNLSGDEARYSFYSPGDGFLAFGCSRLSRDRTGAIGSFAHHFICTESDFVQSQQSPATVLKYLIDNSKFLEKETQLPAERSLPPEEFELSLETTRTPEFQPLAANLLNLYLDKSEKSIPLVVSSDNDAWQILAETFRLLPQLEAAHLSFSTLFTEASDFAGSFRLVFIPDSKYLPPDAYNYTVFEPGVTEIKNPKSPVALTELLLTAPADYEAFLELIHVLRHAPEKLDEVETHFARLILHGKLFRDCVEFLNAPRIFELVLRRRSSIVAYGRAGRPLNYSDLSPVLWAHKDDYLPELLAAIGHLDDRKLRDSLLIDVARRVVKGDVPAEVLGQLVSTDLDHFFALAHDLSIDERCYLAETLTKESFYGLQLHNQIARYLVSAIAEGRGQSWQRIGQWLQQQEKHLSLEPFAKAAIAMARWAGEESFYPPMLNDYRIAPVQYEALLEALWTTATKQKLPPADFDQAAFDMNHRGPYFSFLVRKLPEANAEVILSFIARRYGSQAAGEASLISAIKRMDNASHLADYLMEELKKHGFLDSFSEKILKDISRRSWRFF